jgi:hypothetical protein
MAKFSVNADHSMIWPYFEIFAAFAVAVRAMVLP